MEIETNEETQIEGMPKIETKRRVTAMDTELSRDPLDESDPGYQQPEPKEEHVGRTPNSTKPEGRGGRGMRGGRGKKQYNAPNTREKKDNQMDRRQEHNDRHEQHDNNDVRRER